MKRDRRARVNNVNQFKGLSLTKIEPMTENQALMFDSQRHVVAHGFAGTGKTFIATYLALDAIIRKHQFGSLTYIRSAVPTRNLGFLPGTEKEKSEAYEKPYKEIAFDLFPSDVNAYEKLKNDGIIRFMTTSFIRGSTLDNTVLIVDECQNMSLHELDSIITRVGENSRIFFCGDKEQNGDLGKEPSGLVDFYKILKRMNHFDFVEFGIEDVVRSGIVRDYLRAKYYESGT